MSGSPFWDFSLSFYARPGVPEICLRLQDRHGVDVNVLLYVLFLAAQGRWLGPKDVARIDALVEPWRRSIVEPLRSVRRALKENIGAFTAGATANFRADIKRVELEAERQLQLTLERLGPPDDAAASSGADTLACARNNVGLLAAHIGQLPDDAIEALLQQFDQHGA